MTTRNRTLLTLLTANLLAMGIANAEELFSWDADSTQIVVEGDQTECLSLRGGSVIDTTEKHAGFGSLRHSLGDTQGDRGCDPRGAAFGGDIFDGGETYFRWWMKISDDTNWGSNQKKAKFGRLTRTNEKNPGYTTMYLLADGFRWAGAFNERGSDNYINLKVDFNPADGSCRGSDMISNHIAQCTDWREYIFYFKRNTCPTCKNGIARIYVNGELADEATNVTFAEFVPDDGVTTFKYAWAGIGGKIYPQTCGNGDSCGTGGTLWIDDISISTDWNSQVIGGAPKPRPPTPLSGSAP